MKIDIEAKGLMVATVTIKKDLRDCLRHKLNTIKGAVELAQGDFENLCHSDGLTLAESLIARLDEIRELAAQAADTIRLGEDIGPAKDVLSSGNVGDGTHV